MGRKWESRLQVTENLLPELIQPKNTSFWAIKLNKYVFECNEFPK